MEQLKAAAEDVFDDIPQPASDVEAEDADHCADQAEEFEGKIEEHALVEITDGDLVQHHFRVTGKQPPHRLYRPVEATGGEWTGQARAAVKRMCGFCEECDPKCEAQAQVVNALNALSRKSDWLQEVLRGAQQVLVDELALGVAGDSGVDRDVRWLQTQAQNNMKEMKIVVKALSAENQEAAVQETEVLQTYLVGNRSLLKSSCGYSPSETRLRPWKTPKR